MNGNNTRRIRKARRRDLGQASRFKSRDEQPCGADPGALARHGALVLKVYVAFWVAAVLASALFLMKT